MAVYVALLRAVNVAGTLLPMADLKSICEDLGFTDVKTYIASGNVLFRADASQAAVAKRLDDALGKRLGKNPGVMIRSAAQLAAIADKAPFPHARPNYLLVHFFNDPPPADALKAMAAPGGEEAKLSGHEIYVHYPDGSGRSKLRLPTLKTGTSRNLNTVRKLAELAAAMEGET
jgi:uncharacterized protein (DUF1697 family)